VSAGRLPEERRVALATVLPMDPAVLAPDEPTSGLDPAGRRESIDLLTGLGQALVAVTHDLLFALEVCPRSVVIGQGWVVADGPTGKLLADEALLTTNRLELLFGFDRSLLDSAAVARDSVDR
jgi:cobalt/nickel transport system ATP-binding protein